MNYFVVNAHWDNRGDEAAIRSMMMELLKLSEDNTVSIQRAIGEFGYFPQHEKIMVVPEFPKSGKKGVLEYYLALLTNGRIVFSKEAKAFYKALKNCNVVLHAPGGPSIGDIYIFQETNKLRRLKLVLRAKKKLMFYAPSMGPFNNKERNKIRKSILNQCDVIVLREAVSKEYLKTLDLNKEAIVTLDSAFQYQFSTEEYKRQFEEYSDLKKFLEKYDGKVIGITVTDLMWNSKYKATGIDKTIRTTFETFVQRLTADNWGVVFIPQLFGNNGDYDYMASFCKDGCFVVDDKHDCFFQQHLISKMYAVIGMRYHSNIFSAKMGTPFISVSYEQKMKGFMEKAGLTDYCMDISDLFFESLNAKFDYLLKNYKAYKHMLEVSKDNFRAEAYKTTMIAAELAAQGGSLSDEVNNQKNNVS